MQPLSRNLGPDLLTSLVSMSLALHLPREIHLCRSSSNVPHLPSFWICYKTFTLWAGCRIPCACHAKPHTYKSGPSPSVFYSRCASRHNGVHFFDISTSKSAPSMVCFVHSDLETCFAPQWRALFRHLNFQKCSETVSFNTVDFEMCFAPQCRAIFHLASGQMAPHPPL